MAENKLVPSKVKSWVAWRNVYTTKDGAPFNLLIEEYGLGRLPNRLEFLEKNGGECPFCKDSIPEGIVYHKEYQEEIEVVTCICELLNYINNFDYKYEDIKVPIKPAKLSEITFNLKETTKDIDSLVIAVDAMQSFIKKPDKWYYIQGYYGSGKTHLLRSVATAMAPIAVYVSAGVLEQKAHEFRKDDDLDYLYDKLVNAPILLLDDVGMEYGAQLVKTLIEKIIDARYQSPEDYPTIIASNKSLSEIQNYIPRAYDRLTDKAISTVLGITVGSYRNGTKADETPNIPERRR